MAGRRCKRCGANRWSPPPDPTRVFALAEDDRTVGVILSKPLTINGQVFKAGVEYTITFPYALAIWRYDRSMVTLTENKDPFLAYADL